MGGTGEAGQQQLERRACDDATFFLMRSRCSCCCASSGGDMGGHLILTTLLHYSAVQPQEHAGARLSPNFITQETRRSQQAASALGITSAWAAAFRWVMGVGGGTGRTTLVLAAHSGAACCSSPAFLLFPRWWAPQGNNGNVFHHYLFSAYQRICNLWKLRAGRGQSRPRRRR